MIDRAVYDRQKSELYHSFSDEDISILKHHGILGMKWGIRRYQNEDGSLTEEGKRRYYIDGNGKYAKRNRKELKEYDEGIARQRRLNEYEQSYTNDLKMIKNTSLYDLTPDMQERALKAVATLNDATHPFDELIDDAHIASKSVWLNWLDTWNELY